MESSSLDNHLRVGFSIGEAGGVGPQLLLHFLEGEGWQESLIPIVFGHRKVIERWRNHLGQRSLRYHLIRTPREAKPESLNLIECGSLSDFSIGKPSPEAGALARRAFVQAVNSAVADDIQLLVSLPVDKSTFYHEVEFPYRGHTEYLRAAFPDASPLMLMVKDTLRIAVLTEHIPLRDVPAMLTIETLQKAVKTFHKCLREDFSIASPRIAILALNPHAGDEGLIGDEEQKIITPAVQQLWEAGIYVGGPYSADGFFGAHRYSTVDGIIALYHDQGLIPFKLLAGWDGYQLTAGLPFVRTSPDHGVAYDKAGSEAVDPSSFIAAVWEGIAIWRRRQNHQQRPL